MAIAILTPIGKERARKIKVSFFRDVDAISVCTPTPDHYEIVKQCLEKNIHIVVEKPFTEMLEQAETLKEAASKSKAVVQGYIENTTRHSLNPEKPWRAWKFFR